MLDAVHRNGSFAFSVAELRRQPESSRELADSTLAQALRLQLGPAPAHPTGCRRAPARLAGAARLTIRSPGVLLRSPAGERVRLARFARTPTADVGSLAPGQFAILRIPTDRARGGWHLAVSPPGPLTFCPLGRGA